MQFTFDPAILRPREHSYFEKIIVFEDKNPSAWHLKTSYALELLHRFGRYLDNIELVLINAAV